MKFEILAAALVTSAWCAPQASTAGGGLVRVPRAPSQAAPVNSAPQITEPFEADSWRERLVSPDLDARMFSFEQLAQRAAIDANAREQLEEWSRASDELAWTSRLLLREVERTPSALTHPRVGLWRVDPFSSEPWGDLERRLDELWKLHDGSSGLWATPQPGGASSSSSAQVEITPDGVKVRITEDFDGQPISREYTAASMEELLTAHPELRDKIAVGSFDAFSRAPAFGPRFDWFLGTPRQDPQHAPASPTELPVRTDILGVVLEELSAEQRGQLGLGEGVGLRIARVEAGTIAEQLALKPGQVLLELDGEPVRSRDDVTKRIRVRAKDAEVRAVYLDRWGQRQEARWRQNNGRSI